MNAFLRMYRGGAVDIAGTEQARLGVDASTGEMDKSETSNNGTLGVSAAGNDVLEESFEIFPSSSSASSSEVSVSAGVFSRVRLLPRLSFRSSVTVRLLALRAGATGVVFTSSAEPSSLELLSPSSFFSPRRG